MEIHKRVMKFINVLLKSTNFGNPLIFFVVIFGYLFRSMSKESLSSYSSDWYRDWILTDIEIVNSPHKGQWREALLSSLLGAWINDWVNNCDAGDLRRHSVHYDVTVMQKGSIVDPQKKSITKNAWATYYRLLNAFHKVVLAWVVVDGEDDRRPTRTTAGKFVGRLMVKHQGWCPLKPPPQDRHFLHSRRKPQHVGRFRHSEVWKGNITSDN